VPRSNGEGVAFLEQSFRDIGPSTVVDVGPGVGTYSDTYRRFAPDARWIGVEIWEPYVDNYGLLDKYDEIILGDVRDVELPVADVYICGDVLEHMPRADAVATIERIRERAPWLMVSIPIIHYEQGALEGNPHEAHLHHWTVEEMSEVLGADPVGRGSQVGAWCVETRNIP
jgi:hypothetical protein